MCCSLDCGRDINAVSDSKERKDFFQPVTACLNAHCPLPQDLADTCKSNNYSKNQKSNMAVPEMWLKSM